MNEIGRVSKMKTINSHLDSFFSKCGVSEWRCHNGPQDAVYLHSTRLFVRRLRTDFQISYEQGFPKSKLNLYEKKLEHSLASAI